MKKLNIFDYLDIIQFLNDYLQGKKAEAGGYSIAKWAKEMRFDNQVTLRFILKKRRAISKSTALALAENLKLSGAETDYFHALIAHGQAKTAVEKQAVGSTLLKLQRGQFQQTAIPAEKAARDVLTPVLLTLLTFEDVPKNVSELARLLEVEPARIDRALQDLVADGVVERTDHQEEYKFGSKTFRVTGGENLKAFYRYWMDRSKDALEMPFEVRRYRALQFALTQEEFTEVTEKMNEYAMMLLTKYQSSELEGRRLYMYKSSVFPISKPFSGV